MAALHRTCTEEPGVQPSCIFLPASTVSVLQRELPGKHSLYRSLRARVGNGLGRYNGCAVGWSAGEDAGQLGGGCELSGGVVGVADRAAECGAPVASHPGMAGSGTSGPARDPRADRPRSPGSKRRVAHSALRPRFAGSGGADTLARAVRALPGSAHADSGTGTARDSADPAAAVIHQFGSMDASPRTGAGRHDTGWSAGSGELCAL